MRRLSCWRKRQSSCSSCRVSWTQSSLPSRRASAIRLTVYPADLIHHHLLCRHSHQEKPVKAACSPAPSLAAWQTLLSSITQCMKPMNIWYALPHQHNAVNVSFSTQSVETCTDNAWKGSATAASTCSGLPCILPTADYFCFIECCRLMRSKTSCTA